MAVISDHQTLMNHVLSDPGNPEGELWVVRDAWEGGFSLRAVIGSGMLANTSMLAAFGRADTGLIRADLSPHTQWRWGGKIFTLARLDLEAPDATAHFTASDGTPTCRSMQKLLKHLLPCYLAFPTVIHQNVVRRFSVTDQQQFLRRHHPAKDPG